MREINTETVLTQAERDDLYEILEKTKTTEREPKKTLTLEDNDRVLSIGGERIHLCPSCLKRYLGLD